MTYKIEISKKSKKFINTLPKYDALKLTQIIMDLQQDPRPRWVEKIKGAKNGTYYRISWGNYRVLYSIKDELLIVLVVLVDGRDDVYKNINKKLK